MTPSRPNLLDVLGRRARQIYEKTTIRSKCEPQTADDLMVELNMEWRKIIDEIEELLRSEPHVLDELEDRFHKEYGEGPDPRFRVDELLAFACLRDRKLNGERDL